LQSDNGVNVDLNIIMKQVFLLTLLLVGALLIGAAYIPQTASKQKAKSNVSKFIGKWKGSEKCSDASASVALLSVTANDSNLLLTGIYSIQGQIKATAKGDTVFIQQQEVSDPNFVNLHIEGKLAFGIDPFSLTGKITIQNNQTPDHCDVKYYK
jgi:hypothetical protein